MNKLMFALIFFSVLLSAESSDIFTFFPHLIFSGDLCNEHKKLIEFTNCTMNALDNKWNCDISYPKNLIVSNVHMARNMIIEAYILRYSLTYLADDQTPCFYDPLNSA